MLQCMMIFLITTTYQYIKMYFNSYTPFDLLMEISINSINDGYYIVELVKKLKCLINVKTL